MTHDELVQRAARWLRKTIRCPVVVTELVTSNTSGEIPDALGWSYGRTFLVECKASRSDFLADARKPFRQVPTNGMGAHRYFLITPGLVSPDELPDGWGLLEPTPKKIRVLHRSHAPTCPCKPAHVVRGCMPAFKPNVEAETSVLLSLIRRLRQGGVRGKAGLHAEDYYSAGEA